MSNRDSRFFGFVIGLALLAGQANAAALANPGLAYSYTYGAGTAIAGPGAAAEMASTFVLNDGFFTTQADIDADAGAVGGYYVNGGQDNGVIFGTGPGNNRSITVDLGLVQNLGPVDMYYSVYSPFAVDAPWQVDGITTDWEQVTQAIPIEGLGTTIKLEFRLESDDIGNFAVW